MATPEKVTRDRIAGAIFAFGAWLTTRPQPVTLGANHDSAPMPELIKRWAAENGLEIDDPRVTNWQEAT